MTYPKAIVISAALIAAAIAFAANQPAYSGLGNGGRYILSPDISGSRAWVIDSETGKTQVCNMRQDKCGVIQMQKW